MDFQIEDFFDMSKPLQRLQIRTSRCRIMSRPPEEDPYPDNAPLENGQSYAQPYQESDMKEFIATYQKNRQTSTTNTLSQLEDATTQIVSTLPQPNPGEGMTNVYEKYNFRKTRTNTLKINQKRETILESLNSSQVTIIEGATGCGKTTQVPQFILDECCEKNQYCNIIVTQPRKIAAISIAKRVCRERDWVLGDVVGYQVGLDSKTGEDTRLQFVTTGVLLQRLAKDHNMNKYTHIILDEVHERDQEMDFTLLVVRKLLRGNSPFVKVILMSATFNTAKFAQYFAIPGGDLLVPCPVINVTNKTEFDVKIIYIDMIKHVGEVEIDVNEPGIHPKLYLTTYKLIVVFDELDVTDEILDAHDGKPRRLRDLDDNQDSKTNGSVLIFLPGIFEIESLYEFLHRRMKIRNYKWHILPLHSSITSEEQQSVFRKAPEGYRKIILSTNIAESSITVPDVKYVIDFCLTKQMVAARDSNFSVLQLVWASKANCDQRAGRVGRVSNGRVYRMVPKDYYMNSFKDECKPEMIRAPLSRIILLSKQLNMGSPKSVLAVAMDPPDLRNIIKTVLHLKEIGGLSPSINGKFDTTDGEITLLGHVMASLPLDVHLSKLIFLGWLFNCLDVCVIMASAMSLKSIFSNPFMERLKAYNSKLIWSDGCMSDPIAFYNAYRVWKHSKQQNYFQRSENSEQNWCKRFCLQAKVMNEVSALELELMSRLKRLHMYTCRSSNLVWHDSEKKLLYKTVIAGAFYPNYFLRSSTVDEHEAVKTLGGRDLYRTVYFSGMDTRQPGELYAKPIKKALSECNRELRVEFDSSSKIYVTFGSDRNNDSEFDKELRLNSSIPGKIPLSVYKAIKMRHLNINFDLKVMKHEESIRLAEQRGIGRMVHSYWEANQQPRALKSSLPGVQTKYVSCVISHFVDCGHFWVHPISMKSVLENIKKTLNEDHSKLKKFDNSYKPYIGQICAALYEGEYYRVRILESGYHNQNLMYKVTYVDYGNNNVISPKDLADFGELTDAMMSQPICCYEVVLAEIKPSEIKFAGANWLEEANNRFIDMCHEKTLNGKVYSVVNGVVACTMYLNSLNLNEWLLQQNYAQFSEETYQSKVNYDIRLSVERFSRDQIEAHNLNQESSDMICGDVEPPEQVDCKYSVKLHGPFSPLEAQVYPLMVATQSKRALIDQQSVNSILLTPNPQFGTEPLIVAGEIAQGQSHENVTLRNTTVMPNIDGLPAILAMLYCPNMKLFTNRKWTRYTKILCGLGCDEKEHPLYKEHDLVINLNTIIDNEDIKKVNKIRGFMGQMMSLEPKILDTPSVLFEHLKCCQAMRNLFKDLWTTKRALVDNSNTGDDITSWKLSAEYKTNLMRMSYKQDELRQVFTMHKVLRLKPDIRADAEELLEFNKMMEMNCRKTQVWPNLLCRICEVETSSISEMRIHMISRVHKELVSSLETAKQKLN